MKETYVAPSAELTHFFAKEAFADAKLSFNFSDFFTKSINDELDLSGGNNPMEL